MSERVPLVVLGLGNVLLEDDGAGAAAVRLLLDRYEAPPEVSVLDGGTLGLSLLPYLESAGAVILVDAVMTGAEPGSLVRLDGDDVAPAVAARLSPHQVGVADLLDGARWLGRYPDHVVLLGVVPESMQLAVGLSPRVQAALPELVDAVINEARALGFVFPSKSSDDSPAPNCSFDVSRLAGMR